MTGKQESVFEKYAHEYDLITNAIQREAYHAREVEAIIARFKPSSTLDAGCGSGLTSMLLAREGVKTVGLDRSRKMLDVCRQKYGDLGLPLTFRQGSFERLPRNMYGKFDLIVSLANSISGLDSLSDLRRSVSNFYRALRPGGWLLLQALNYTSITENSLLPIKVTNNEGILWARYARRQGKRYGVHVIRLDLNTDPPGFEPFCHEFDNFSPVEIGTAMERAGFRRISRYSSLYFDKRFSKASRDLVITGYRPTKD